MTKAYDLVIIGTGTAAMVASQRTAAAGWKVAVIDFRPFGGTCALRGCDPKKMLIGGATAIDHVRRMKGKGPEGQVRINWPELITFKRSFTDPVPAKNEHRYAEKGIETFHGRARFTGRNTVEVGGETLEARHILIAAGAEPIQLGIPGEEHLATSEDFLALEQLPKRIVLVGGGFIAAEFSHIAARAGAEVTILQRGPRMLPNFDPDLVEVLMEKFREIGVNVKVDTAVKGIEKDGSGFVVRAASDGQPRTFKADLVVHSAGRAPALESLDLDAGGLAHHKGRLKLNEFLQSVSNPVVYAAGDAAQMGPPLTPVSSHDAKIVAANLLNGNAQTPNYFGVPSVAFTIPPIAAVGLSERDARAQGLRFRTQHQTASEWFTARQAAEPTYAFKVMVEDKTDRILGAHLVGPHADEVINLFALAIQQGITAEAVKSTMFAYPTGASDIGYML
ncbi:MAG: NAD(P)/FAD-dependent oxidoreductase [Bosea sp.]|uniref:dihydrolipoyl dehydrogenase family protein n=1 Tax=Bosea sp. (in: a-proteobacteria) TaxID=1871050 RepID=UPI0023954E72|nr:NAD(P)/FAD-dependent oxidoreductase [Bosea sp. (in: a-proteobacteria)]MCP4740351.1 NAD(P)/FAD-dependent oxidoreductase [Bosea sp. (in: a-proteobacteria)]